MIRRTSWFLCWIESKLTPYILQQLLQLVFIFLGLQKVGLPNSKWSVCQEWKCLLNPVTCAMQSIISNLRSMVLKRPVKIQQKQPFENSGSSDWRNLFLTNKNLVTLEIATAHLLIHFTKTSNNCKHYPYCTRSFFNAV